MTKPGRPVKVSLHLFMCIAACLAAAAGAADIRDYVAAAPFKMPDVPLPSFQNRRFPITDHGAVGDGQTLNTDAFAKAIKACAAEGGGHVIVPPGLWLTGPIELRSNVNLHLERGALVVFTGDHSEYPVIRRPGGRGGFGVVSPVFGNGLHNIAITGEGIMDGSGETWRPVKREKTTEDQWDGLLKSGGATSNNDSVWWPTREAMAGEEYMRSLEAGRTNLTPADYLPARDFLRPNMVYLSECDTVLIEGVTLRNSPRFTLSPYFCSNITIRNVSVFNEWWAQNGDGIDITSCHNVIIYRCDVSAGDDGICMKSSRRRTASNNDALRNVIVAECTVYRGHGGFVIGSNTDGGMSNIWATRCTFIGTDIGIRVKSSMGSGGPVRDIVISDIVMHDILNEAILVDPGYASNPVSASSAPLPPENVSTENIPDFGPVAFRSIHCSGAGRALVIRGLEIRPVHNLSFSNMLITAREGIHASNTDDISIENVKILVPGNPAPVLRNCRNFLVDGKPAE